MSEGLRVERDGAVTTVVLDRPERLNALSYDVIRELARTLEELRGDPAQRVVLLTGAGRAFSAGIDLKEQAAGEVWDERVGRTQERYALQQAVADLVVSLRRIPQPVIAVVAGVAAGRRAVARLVPAGEGLATARSLAAEMLAVAPMSTRMTKSLLNLSRDGATLDQMIEYENRTQILLAQTGDFAEGISAFAERRPARFGDR